MASTSSVESSSAERLLADRYWNNDVFSSFPELGLTALTQAFAERILAQLHTREIITDDIVAQILSLRHSGLGVLVPP